MTPRTVSPRARYRRWSRRATHIGLALPLAGSALIAQVGGAPPAGRTGEATVSTPAPRPDSAAPVLEPYRFNARERTARALAEWERGQAEAAVAPLESALRLRPGDPLTEFNAGTARLGAQRPDAAELLEKAAQHAPPELAPDALYNLGNARLAAEDARGAIEAYKGSLRSRPDFAAAKRNLELALRLLDQQQQQQQQQQDQQPQGQQQKPDPSQQPNGDPNADSSRQQERSSEKQEPSDPSSEPQNPPPGGGEQPGDPGSSNAPQRDRPLPQFKDQEDMSAEQAAAILQAVENLERQQRRDQARAAAKAKTSVEKDW